MVDLHPLALAYLRAMADYATGDGTTDAVDDADDGWTAAGCPIELPAPDRAGFVRVRIAVTVDAAGGWECGRHPDNMIDHPNARLTYVEAWVPKPAGPETVEGEVSDGS